LEATKLALLAELELFGRSSSYAAEHTTQPWQPQPLPTRIDSSLPSSGMK
jgi:hypothetical protein